jgi:hypothetical protein
VITDRLDLDPAAFAAATGWVVKPEGACAGQVCVPLPDDARVGDDRLDATVLADRLAMPVVADEAHGVWALGPATVTGRALATAELPEIELPDLDGRPFEFSSLRETKVVLAVWAPW